MTALLVAFAAVLLVAVMLSNLARRTVLSTAVIFLAAGFLLGSGVTDVLPLAPEDDVVRTLAELALFTVLFSDGMRAGWSDLRSAWRLPGRALVLGLPLTLGVTALLAHLLTDLSWVESLLLGAVLAPTDPVFAAALVGDEKVPRRLRHLLNVESGLNDGLALPFVLVLLSVASGAEDLDLGTLAGELAVGLAIGVVVPLVALKLEATRFFAASRAYQPLTAVAIGLLVLGLGQATHGNLFLAAFAAGVTTATVSPQHHEAFEEFGELVSELLKLAALLVFGALISPQFLGEIPPLGWALAVAVIVVARPVALFPSFLGTGLPVREQVAAAWFGPKGFASVVYGLLVLGEGIPASQEVFHLVALTIVLSVLAHSSTDVVVARWFEGGRGEDDGAEDDRAEGDRAEDDRAGSGDGGARAPEGGADAVRDRPEAR